MKIMEFVSTKAVAADLKATTKEAVIKELSGLLAKAGAIKDDKTLVRTLLDREALGSTGIGQGVGIPHGKCSAVKELVAAFGISSFTLFLVLRRLSTHGWIFKQQEIYHLTGDGNRKASSIVRLHRLWELYLADTLKLHSEKVHKTAEEMEHIITPDIEERLTKLLSNPIMDPHQQPIPNKAEV